MKKIFSATALKYVAILAMTIDHIAYVFVQPNSITYYVMRLFGRLTAPIMTYFIVEGFVYTKNRKKYFFRILLFAIIAQPFYFAMIFLRIPQNQFEFMTNLNVMFTLCLSLLSLIILENKKISLYIKGLLIGLCFALADICDWSYIVPTWAIIFFLLRKDNVKKAVAFIGISVVLLIQRFLPLYDNFLQFSYQFGVIFALIPINLYNGKEWEIKVNL